MGIAASFKGNRAGREDGHSPWSNAKIKNEGSLTSTPAYTFMAWTGTSLY